MIKQLQHWLAPVVAPGFVTIVRQLGEERSRKLAPFVGKVLRMGARERTLSNMKTILRYDGLPERKWDALWKEHVRHLGLSIIESLHLFWSSNAQLLAQTELNGEEHLRAALKAGHGAVLLINHCGTLIAAAAALGLRGYEVVFAGNGMPVEYVERLAQEFFRRVGTKRVLLGNQLPFKAGELLQRNGIFAGFSDFTVVKKHNVYVKMGSGEKLVNIGPELIAVRNHASVLYLSNKRLPNNHHHLTIHPALEFCSSGDPLQEAQELAQKATNLLMNDLRRNPEQWWQWYSNRIRILHD